MKVQEIKLSELVVNNSNDRHGELSSPELGMSWLLEHRAAHMRKLTKDIVSSGEIYEAPLVLKENGKYIVYDGNRRTTCLKFLSDPQSAPNESWREFFSIERSRWNGNFPSQISCQVEEDRERIDEILYRRHTGGQGGVGQSPWDPEAKSNFVKRTGKHTKVNVAEEIEAKLREANLLADNVKVPRSNLNRLLSSDALRNRVGISVEKNKLKITHNEEKVMGALLRICSDLIEKNVVLEGIWDNKGKRKYLDILENDGILPSAKDSLEKEKPLKSKPKKETENYGENRGNTTYQLGGAPKPHIRRALIRTDIDYGIIQQPHTARCYDIWQELQYHLYFDKHNNAISVLFRVLIENAINNYIQRCGVVVYDKDRLSSRFVKVVDHMLENGDLSKKEAQNIKKFEKSESIVSVNTLNAYVHSENFFPSDLHLNSMFDNLSHFLVLCLNK
ncbi:hypothetical protein P8T57_01755 [Thalassospira sp. SN3W]|uniref:hypothetical protein n=1 Tax=Thalassospira sp. SN3W TaxID=3035476 RepID=UPI00311AD15A